LLEAAAYLIDGVKSGEPDKKNDRAAAKMQKPGKPGWG